MRVPAAVLLTLLSAGCAARKKVQVQQPAPSTSPAQSAPRRTGPAVGRKPRITPPPVITSPPREVPALQSRTDAARDAAAIQARLTEVRTELVDLSRQVLTGTLKDNRDRVASMLDLAQKAFDTGNLRQADDLSSRAAILAKTILDAR